jgi:Tol biopolymer transport system component
MRRNRALPVGWAAPWSGRRAAAVVAAVVGLAAVVGVAGGGALIPATTHRVSVATDGTEGNGISLEPSISNDGRYVAFASAATNLVPGDSGGVMHVYVHDLEEGTTVRASVASDGTPGNGRSERPSISGDGRYVAFESAADNLVTDDTNDVSDIFVRDLVAGTTERVSVASDESEGDRASYWPSISDDGRYVAFFSDAALAPGIDAGTAHIYVRDVAAGETQISTMTENGPANGHSMRPAISGNGRYVAFESFANNLVAGDTNNSSDVFVFDRETGETERVSVRSDGSQALKASTHASINRDGRVVAFQHFGLLEQQGGFLPGPIAPTNVYVRDRLAGTTELVEAGPDWTPPNGISTTPSVSWDGWFIAFASAATNLDGDTGNFMEVYVYDRVTKGSERVSVAWDGGEADGASSVLFGGFPGDGVSVSGGGMFVAFSSLATNLVEDDTNGTMDVFVRERCAFEPGNAGHIDFGPGIEPPPGGVFVACGVPVPGETPTATVTPVATATPVKECRAVGPRSEPPGWAKRGGWWLPPPVPAWACAGGARR